MVPTSQDFKSDNSTGLKIHLRLEVRDELAVLETVADPLLDLPLRDQGPLHAGIEPHRPRDAPVARMVHRDVRPPKQVGNARVGTWGSGNPGKNADLHD